MPLGVGCALLTDAGGTLSGWPAARVVLHYGSLGARREVWSRKGVCGLRGLCGVALRRGVQRALEARVQQRARATPPEEMHQRVELPLERLAKGGRPPCCAGAVLELCWGCARAVLGLRGWGGE